MKVPSVFRTLSAVLAAMALAGQAASQAASPGLVGATFVSGSPEATQRMRALKIEVPTFEAVADRAGFNVRKTDYGWLGVDRQLTFGEADRAAQTVLRLLSDNRGEATVVDLATASPEVKASLMALLRRGLPPGRYDEVARNPGLRVGLAVMLSGVLSDGEKQIAVHARGVPDSFATEVAPDRSAETTMNANPPPAPAGKGAPAAGPIGVEYLGYAPGPTARLERAQAAFNWLVELRAEELRRRAKQEAALLAPMAGEDWAGGKDMDARLLGNEVKSAFMSSLGEDEAKAAAFLNRSRLTQIKTSVMVYIGSVANGRRSMFGFSLGVAAP